MNKSFWLILILVFIFGFFIGPFVLKVKITCTSQYGSCPLEITNLLQKHSGESLFFAKKSVRKELNSSYLVSNFSMQFKLPNILNVDILIKKPDFAIFYKNFAEYALVSSDGKILTVSKDNVLPFVSTTEGLGQGGQEVTKEDLFALKIVLGVYEMYQIQSGEEQNQTLVVELPAGVRVIFPLSGDSDVLLGSLRLIYAKILAGGASKYSQIDLRFKNPVLR